MKRRRRVEILKGGYRHYANILQASPDSVVDSGGLGCRPSLRSRFKADGLVAPATNKRRQS